jgi:hypothetical protein
MLSCAKRMFENNHKAKGRVIILFITNELKKPEI